MAKNYRLKKRELNKRKPVSMQEFLKTVRAVAASAGKTYCTVSCEIANRSLAGTHTMNFGCYVDGYSYYYGISPDECISKLKDAIFNCKPIQPADALA